MASENQNATMNLNYQANKFIPFNPNDSMTRNNIMRDVSRGEIALDRTMEPNDIKNKDNELSKIHISQNYFHQINLLSMLENDYQMYENMNKT